MCKTTLGFRHSFREVDGLIYMDLPEVSGMEWSPSKAGGCFSLTLFAACLQEIASEDLKTLASMIAEEAGFVLGFCAKSDLNALNKGPLAG